MIFDLIVSGLISGSTYALLAIGFSLIFGVARIVNIAHTAFYMVAAYLIFFGTHRMGLPTVPSMLISIVLVTILGIICYKLFVEPIREHEATVLIATIALAMVFQEVMLLVFGGEFQSVPNIVSGFLKIGGTKITYQQLLTLGSAFIILGGVWALLLKTRLGLAIRSMAQDSEVANLMGMNESFIALMTMAVSVALAALAGAVVVPLTVVNPHMWTTPLVMMMAVVVLGGMGSLKGSFVGAFIMGFAEAMVVFLLPNGAYLKLSVALSIMILVLVIRPEGLYGVAFEEER